MGQKHKTLSGKKLVPNKTTIFLIDCCRQWHFLSELVLSFGSIICLVRSFPQWKISKILSHFEWFNFIDTDNAFHKSNFATLNVALSSYQQFCTVKRGLVSECLSPANPLFIINEILNFGTAMVVQIFQLFFHWTGKTLGFYFMQSIHSVHLEEEF